MGRGQDHARKPPRPRIDRGGLGLLTVNQRGEYPERVAVYGPDGVLFYRIDD